MTEKQCDYVMAPLLRRGLPSAGIVRTLPRQLVYGPIEFQGIGIPNLYVAQELSHIERILKYATDEENLTGQLSMEQMVVEIGLNSPIFPRPYDLLGGLATNCWLKKTWEFVDRHAIRFEDKTPKMTLWRDNDEFLTALFVQHGYQGEALRKLNQCRIYLQVVSVADIATGDGTGIRKAALEGSCTI